MLHIIMLEPLRLLCCSRTGWFGTVVEYGAERKISRHSVVSATVSVGVPQGVILKIKYCQLTVGIVMIFSRIDFLWMFSCLTSGWHVPVKTICFQSIWQTSFYPALSSMLQLDPCSPTWPSTNWSSSHIQKPRKKSKPPFCSHLF